MVHLPQGHGSLFPVKWLTFPRDMVNIPQGQVHLPKDMVQLSPVEWFTFPKDMVHLSQWNGWPSPGTWLTFPKDRFTSPRTWFNFPQWNGSPSPRTWFTFPKDMVHLPKDIVHLPHLCMCKLPCRPIFKQHWLIVAFKVWDSVNQTVHCMTSTHAGFSNSPHFQTTVMNYVFQGSRGWGTVWIRQFSPDFSSSSPHFQTTVTNYVFQGSRGWGTVWIRQFSADFSPSSPSFFLKYSNESVICFQPPLHSRSRLFAPTSFFSFSLCLFFLTFQMWSGSHLIFFFPNICVWACASNCTDPGCLVVVFEKKNAQPTCFVRARLV